MVDFRCVGGEITQFSVDAVWTVANSNGDWYGGAKETIRDCVGNQIR